MKAPEKEKAFIPVDLYDWMKKIEEHLNLKASGTAEGKNIEGLIGDFISQEKAEELTGRGTTWFYYRRKEGRIKSYKLGSKIFYRMSDLEKLIEDGEQ